MSLIESLLKIGTDLIDANRVHPALVGAVQHRQAQGYDVQYLSERSAKLIKKGLIWDSRITLQVGDDGQV